jgi:hypothetical protein
MLERARLMKPHFRQPLIATRAGNAFTGSGFATLWRRTMSAFPKGREADRFSSTISAPSRRVTRLNWLARHKR